MPIGVAVAGSPPLVAVRVAVAVTVAVAVGVEFGAEVRVEEAVKVFVGVDPATPEVVGVAGCAGAVVEPGWVVEVLEGFRFVSGEAALV